MFPKTLEHTRNYLVNIQVFGDKVLEDNPVELNYVATSFDINYSGGADFVHQKGRRTASVFAMQPTVSVSISCYMTEPEFSVIVSNIITNQQHVLIRIGKLRDSINKFDIISETVELEPNQEAPAPTVRETSPLVDPSATIYEIVGYMRDARISANVGQFIIAEFTINADDINEFDPNALLEFNA